jgi:hypothetical protein
MHLISSPFTLLHFRRSDAEHAENEAEIENTPLWWGRLLTQPLEFTAPAWSACQCLNLPAAAQTGDSDHPLVVCAHLLRLDQDPVAPFLPRTLPGKSPSITVAAQPESHPFGIPKRSADAISNSLLNASLSTRISTTVECLDKIGSWEFDVFGLTRYDIFQFQWFQELSVHHLLFSVQPVDGRWFTSPTLCLNLTVYLIVSI